MPQTEKILSRIQRLQIANTAIGQELEALVRELGKYESPVPPRQRQNLKADRVLKYEASILTGKWGRAGIQKAK